ncbi:hypothetical protein DI09_18p320 [Mitosporidium daphniae]|uniref:SRP54-type proteins GTP-binding domain-containing protein n=1 Tax=Mitosporidium daphniae TaxID=1485682 RepID=A0A098VX57_9MICR|nr:uncharacterized protein DI09_18p320 [Mitosporidium daphniae]KGG52326.1 hypothetical protein DI09_18p320 [Mitosporidium daphniae]|eukprot:XP_013238753.1 uncharacterized protein DI09_18p320 [Mitosporidium daphniae]
MFDFAAIVSFGGLLYWTSGPLCKTYLNYTSEFIRKVLIESTISTSEKHYITSDNKQAFQWLIDEKRKLIFLVFCTYVNALSTISNLELIDSFGIGSKGYPAISDYVQKYLNESIYNILKVSSVSCAGDQIECIETPICLQDAEPKPSSDPANRQAKQPLRRSKKINRKWDDPYYNGEDNDLSELNFGSEDQTDQNIQTSSMISLTGIGEEVPELRKASSKALSPNSGILSSLWGKINEISGISKCLSHENLASPLLTLKESLIAKNVAESVASEVCSAVERKLVGKELSAFSASGSLNTIIRDATSLIIQQILTPSDDSRFSNDIFLGMAEAKEQGRPFVAALVGVNGVGKSTSLSKLVYWTLQRGFRVLVVAGDTFRSGAVEQLSVHVKNLSKVGSVTLFERGYGKDAASLAKEAIQHAKANAIDVVFIDTAGRMQDNTPLMKSLAKVKSLLISIANPDRIIFVGEALVGNEAVDQLLKFNASLIKDAPLSSPTSRPRIIDGIVLTKFDTIDDKVGAAVSMAHISGAPILFVGVGQTYLDLRRLNVTSVVDSLLGV